MSNKKSLILTEEQVQQKIVRMASEMYEQYHDSEAFFLVGIEKRGFLLAQLIGDKLAELSKVEVTALPIKLDKKDLDRNTPTTNLNQETVKGKTIFLVDDVLNSGKTLMHAAMHLMSFHPSSLKTVVLVNRRHRLFPIRADIVGLSLATTMKEHISVELSTKKIGVYLS